MSMVDLLTLKSSQTKTAEEDCCGFTESSLYGM